MKPQGRKSKYYTANCPSNGYRICACCYKEHKWATKGKMKSNSNGINRAIQKRINSYITQEQFSYE